MSLTVRESDFGKSLVGRLSQTLPLCWRVKKLGWWGNGALTRSLVPVPVPPRVAGIQAENLNCVLNKTYADSFPSRFRDLKIIKIHKFLLPFLQATFILNKNTFFFSRKQNTSIKDEFSKQPGKYLQKFPKMC